PATRREEAAVDFCFLLSAFCFPMKSVVLLSGGLDSATVLAIARAEQRECIALSFAYGQRHEIELAAATRVARAGGAHDHVVYNLDLRQFGASALTDDI